MAFSGLSRGAELAGSDSPDAPAASEEGIEYLHNAVIYNGAVANMPVAVMLSSRPFDPSIHQIEKVEGREDDWLLDGNRILGADGLPKKGFPQLNDVVVYEGAANGVTIKVTASTRPFDYARHKVGKRTGNEWESDGSDTWRATIDGEPVIGTMGNEPHEGDSQLAEVVVRIGGKAVRIPAERLAHVISPQLHQIPGRAGPTVTASANGKVVQVEIPAGWDKSLPILVSDDGQFQFIRAPNPGP
jgi:hypothetical protein